MRKVKLISFNSNNTVVSTTRLPWLYLGLKNTIRNPNLFDVRDKESYFLKRFGKKVMQMSRPEKLKRLEDIRREGLNEGTEVQTRKIILVLIMTGIMGGAYQWLM